jgi:hypothetical protein
LAINPSGVVLEGALCRLTRGTLLTPPSGLYKRKIAIPMRMMTMIAIAYLISLVNPIQVRRCRSSSVSIAVIATPPAEEPDGQL